MKENPSIAVSPRIQTDPDARNEKLDTGLEIETWQHVLQTWRAPEPCSGFDDAVWRQIRTGECLPAARLSAWALKRPAWTAAAAAVALAVGVWSGTWTTSRKSPEPTPLLAEWTLTGSYLRLASDNNKSIWNSRNQE